MPLGAIVEMVNIGTLFAFILVNIGVMVLRRTRPDMPRPFKVPVPYIWCPIGIILCIYLSLGLPWVTYVRFVVWLVVGTRDLPAVRVLALPATAPLSRTSLTCRISNPTRMLLQTPSPEAR